MVWFGYDSIMIIYLSSVFRHCISLQDNLDRSFHLLLSLHSILASFNPLNFPLSPILALYPLISLRVILLHPSPLPHSCTCHVTSQHSFNVDKPSQSAASGPINHSTLHLFTSTRHTIYVVNISITLTSILSFQKKSTYFHFISKAVWGQTDNHYNKASNFYYCEWKVRLRNEFIIWS